MQSLEKVIMVPDLPRALGVAAAVRWAPRPPFWATSPGYLGLAASASGSTPPDDERLRALEMGSA